MRVYISLLAKKKVFDDVEKEFNRTMHKFGKLMAKHKIHTGVCSKLLVPFMRFHSKIRTHNLED